MPALARLPRQDLLRGCPKGGAKLPRGPGVQPLVAARRLPRAGAWCGCLDDARGLCLLRRPGARVPRCWRANSPAARVRKRWFLLGLRPSPQLFRRLRRNYCFCSFRDPRKPWGCLFPGLGALVEHVRGLEVALCLGRAGALDHAHAAGLHALLQGFLVPLGAALPSIVWVKGVSPFGLYLWSCNDYSLF